MCATVNDFSSLSLPGSREEGRRCECSLCLLSLAPGSPALQAQTGKSQLGLLTRNTTLKAGAAPATGQVPALTPGWAGLTCGRNAQPPSLSPGFREGGSGRLRGEEGIPGKHLSHRVPLPLRLSESPHPRAGPRPFFKRLISFWMQSFNGCLVHYKFSSFYFFKAVAV